MITKGKGIANEAASDHKVLCSTRLGTMERVQRESEKETLTVVKAKGCSRIESFLDGWALLASPTMCV